MSEDQLGKTTRMEAQTPEKDAAKPRSIEVRQQEQHEGGESRESGEEKILPARGSSSGGGCGYDGAGLQELYNAPIWRPSLLY